MKMNEMFYVAPEVEIVEVAIEQGFAASPFSENGTGAIDGAVPGGVVPSLPPTDED